MPSMIEHLPDEILMVIIEYSGDVLTILSTYLGLNQRLNRILLDRRLHLLTDFLGLPSLDDYHYSERFQRASAQFVRARAPLDQKELVQILQPLLRCCIHQRYIQLGLEFQSMSKTLQSIRQQLSADVKAQVDHELEKNLRKLHDNPALVECMESVKSLILIRGARLECYDDPHCQFNFTKVVNHLLLSHINRPTSKHSISLSSYAQLFKFVLVSNPFLSTDRDDVGNAGFKLEYFLLHNLYALQYYHAWRQASKMVNVPCYRATVDLFLFALHCQSCVYQDRRYVQQCLLYLLRVITEINSNLCIQTAQLEILKIMLDEFTIDVDELRSDELGAIFQHLLIERRLDVIRRLHYRTGFVEVFHDQDSVRRCIGLMSSTQLKSFVINVLNESTDLIYLEQHLLFILLDRKDRKLIEKLLKASPQHVHQLDERGNDLLLYLCLHVHGCRHRIIEYLIKAGADIHRRNFAGQDFMAALHLPRNNNLRHKLLEHEVIGADLLCTNGSE